MWRAGSRAVQGKLREVRSPGAHSLRPQGQGSRHFHSEALPAVTLMRVVRGGEEGLPGRPGTRGSGASVLTADGTACCSVCGAPFPWVTGSGSGLSLRGPDTRLCFKQTKNPCASSSLSRVSDSPVPEATGTPAVRKPQAEARAEPQRPLLVPCALAVSSSSLRLNAQTPVTSIGQAACSWV